LYQFLFFCNFCDDDDDETDVKHFLPHLIPLIKGTNKIAKVLYWRDGVQWHDAGLLASARI